MSPAAPARDGQRDAYGGVLGVTKGLIGEFGEARVIDTPITEVGDHGCRRGRRGDRVAPGCRADVLRLLRCLLRPDLQPGGQVPLYVRRQGQDAAGDPHDDRRRAQRRRAAFAEPLSHLHLGAGPQMRGAVERLRRQGAADPGDPRRRPGDLLRAQADVRSARRGPGRALYDPVRRGQHRARRRRCDGRRPRAHGALCRRSGRDLGRRGDRDAN